MCKYMNRTEWLNQNMNENSCVLAHHAFLSWARLHLDRNHTIIHLNREPNQSPKHSPARAHSSRQGPHPQIYASMRPVLWQDLLRALTSVQIQETQDPQQTNRCSCCADPQDPHNNKSGPPAGAALTCEQALRVLQLP